MAFVFRVGRLVTRSRVICVVTIMMTCHLSRPCLALIPSQVSHSEEGCHWFEVGFSPDVFIHGVVLLGLASSPSLRYHLCRV